MALIAYAFVSCGRWVATCPQFMCTNAETIGICDDKSVGGLTGDRFTCRIEYGGCGLVCEASWPAQIDTITQVLDARPVPMTRNWVPGESIIDLIAQNLEHGLPISDVVTNKVLDGGASRMIGAP